MKTIVFTGETPAQALKRAQEQCGEDAYVISTKMIRAKSINQSALYEIIVGVEDELYEQKERAPQPLKSNDVLLNISEAAKQISQITNSTKGNPQYQPRAVEEPTKELTQIKTQIDKLNDKLKLIQDMFWDEKAPQRGNLAIPPEFAQIFKLAGQSGMSNEHLSTIMRLTLEYMPSNMRNSSQTIKRYFQVLLRKMIPIRSETPHVRGQQKVMMFIGPTGVGKTTTLAKIAARYSYLNPQKQKVGIITLDTYRIGAVEQLFQYAKMMRLPVEDVVDVNDFENAINSLSNCDVILVDTVGSSQYDKDKLQKLDNFLKSCSAQIDVNLVMSAGTKLDDLKEIYNNFSFLNIDTLIFTKFDETKMFGNIFSLIYEIDKPISYFSTGQEVPDDLCVASSGFLVECMLDGFRKEVNGHSGK